MQDSDVPQHAMPAIEALRATSAAQGCTCHGEVLGWPEITERWDTLPILIRKHIHDAAEQMHHRPDMILYLWHTPGECPLTGPLYADMN